jgi:hypothetical protein
MISNKIQSTKGWVTERVLSKHFQPSRAMTLPHPLNPSDERKNLSAAESIGSKMKHTFVYRVGGIDEEQNKVPAPTSVNFGKINGKKVGNSRKEPLGRRQSPTSVHKFRCCDIRACDT